MAVLVVGDVIPVWQRRVLEELVAVVGVELCVFGLSGSAGVRRREHGGWLWRTFQRLATIRSSALRSATVPEELGAVPRVQIHPPANHSGSGPAMRDAGGLAEHRSDVVLDLADHGPSAELMSPDMELWSMQHGADPDGIAAVWELVDGIPLTQVVLKRTALNSDGELEHSPLVAATFPTVTHSPRRNIDQAYLGAVDLPALACRMRLSEVQHRPSVLSPRPASPRPRSMRTWGSAVFLGRLAVTWANCQKSGLTSADRWHVGIVHRRIESLLEQPLIDDVQWFPRPEGAERYVADPFGCTAGDTTVVLVEDFDHRDRHGRIGSYLLHDPGHGPPGAQAPWSSSHQDPTGILTLPTHASYPYLVDVQGATWCVPETSAANEVRAFELDVTGPSLRDLGPILPGVSLVDPTLFEWEGRWWLLGTDRSKGANTHLRAWWSDDPMGPWVQHAVDPLCIDVRWARGAGTPFVHENTLYRPAQDCSQRYGGSVAIRRVLRLAPDDFEEETAVEIRPDSSGPYPHGLHTISRVGDSFLVDGSMHRFSRAAFVHELRGRFDQAVRRQQAP